MIFEMSVNDALTLFDMSASDLGDVNLIKKKYRELSIKHHPDKGGDLETMKKVNDAKITLDKAKAGSSSGKFDWDAMNKKYQELGKRIKEKLMKDFKSENYTKYFEKIYDEKFDYEQTKEFPKDKDRSPHYAGFQFDFFNKDRSIVFEIYVSANLVESQQTNVLGGGQGNISFPLLVHGYGFYNNRKLKISQRDWKSTSDHDVLTKPELVFPEKKLQQFKTKSKDIVFKKKDMITYLTKKLKGSWDGQWVKIPLKDDLKLYLARNVFMRQAGWSPQVFKKWKGVPGGVYVTFPETLETAQYFEGLVKGALKKKSENDMIKYIHGELKKYRASRQ